jgi:hypothetical protein
MTLEPNLLLTAGDKFATRAPRPATAADRALHEGDCKEVLVFTRRGNTKSLEVTSP